MVGLGWPDAARMLQPLAWLALGLALVTGLWSMVTLFLDNRDLWRREIVEMEKR
jgi:hypothetical protein